MNTIKLECISYQKREIFATDYSGNQIKGDSAREIGIQYPARIFIDSKYVWFLVKSFMSKKLLIDSEKQLEFVFLNSNKTLIDFLKRSDSLNIFSPFELYVTEDIIINSENEQLIFEVNKELYFSLNESMKKYYEINSTIEKVIQKLQDYSTNLNPTGFEYYKNEMITYWNFLKYSFNKAYNNTLPNYNESLKYIYTSIDELSRRKRENNHNYQHAKRTLEEKLFSLHAPNIWLEEPFIPQEIKNKFGTNK